MKTTAILTPFKGIFSTPKSNMEASESSTCIAANSHNRTINVVEVHETYNINYGAMVRDAGTLDAAPSAGGAQTARGVVDVVPSSGSLGKDGVLVIPSRTRSDGTISSTVSEEEDDEEHTTPTISSPTINFNTPQDPTGHISRTVRVIDTKERIEGSTPKCREDNLSRLTRGSARTSQYSSYGKGSRFKLSKLKIEDLRFSEPVEKHIKTYMTSKKQNFGHDSKYAICLWHPFSSLDLDTSVQEQHCILGDVGRFNSRGGFDVMFNIFMTMEENRKMGYFPPTTFTHFKSIIRHWSRVPGEESQFFMTYDLMPREDGTKSSGVYSFQTFKHPERPGSAILVAPGCSAKELNRNLMSSIRSYLRDHVESWYDPNNYPNEQHENLSIGSLNLICTCYKSKVWAAAAATHQLMMAKQERPLTAKLFRSSNKTDEYEWDVHPLYKVNRGSSKPDVPQIEYTVAVEVCPLGLPSSGGSVLGRVFQTKDKTPFSSIFR